MTVNAKKSSPFVNVVNGENINKAKQKARLVGPEVSKEAHDVYIEQIKEYHRNIWRQATELQKEVQQKSDQKIAVVAQNDEIDNVKYGTKQYTLGDQYQTKFGLTVSEQTDHEIAKQANGNIQEMQQMTDDGSNVKATKGGQKYDLDFNM